MARKRYTAEKIISQLRTVEIETAKGIGIVDACRKLGITEQTYRYAFSRGNSSIPYWRPRYGLNAGDGMTTRSGRTAHGGIGHRPLTPSHPNRSVHD